jgi:subtilisin family serine protease
MRRALLAAALVLVIAPPARADDAATGRLLVTLHPGAAPRAAAAVAAAAGAPRVDLAVPRLRLVAVRPARGRSLRALAARLRADPRVALVEVEHRARLRYDPNDPALTATETAPGTVPGIPVEWWAGRSGFQRAWDVSRGDGAVVAVIDSGADTSHPDLVDRVAGAASFDGGDPGSVADDIGHGTHVASLACGAGDNGVGLAGAGLHCKLLIVKSDLSDASVAGAIVWSVDHGADAINMSFGTDPGVRPSHAVRNAIDYAVAHRVVLAAAAADEHVAEQGYPADLLQPTGTGRNVDAGKGLSVTAADAFDRRASFAGHGSQISLAAYGAYDGTGATGPPGIFGAFTTATNQLEIGGIGVPPRPPCACRTIFAGDSRYAYLKGTSMATPMVAATGALMRHLNPDLPALEIVRLIKQTARRPAGVWTGKLGWGILDAGAALVAAAADDRRAPVSRVASLPARTRRRTVTVRWSGTDAAPPGIRASGISRYELWRSTDGGRSKRLFTTRGTARRIALRRGGRYAFYTVAIDHAGNRESPPARADARIDRVARASGR